MRAVSAPDPVTSSVDQVRETLVGDPAILVHDGWAEAFPWLIQGTTTRGPLSDPFDLGLFSDGSPEEMVRGRFARLREVAGAHRIVHARQVHGSIVRAADGRRGGGRPAPTLVDPCDGHLTRAAGVLLAVSVADCVPVFIVDPRAKAAAVVHAGWRGAAAGVLEEAFRAMASTFDSRVDDLWLHLGPAICGACYEVGPEVFEALREPVPDGPTPIDLRRTLAGRALSGGLPASQITISEHCTRCTGSNLFSHRGGDSGRQVGFLAVRPS